MKDSLSKRVYGSNTIKRITNKVRLLGIKMDPNLFIGFRFVSSFILFIFLFIIFDYGYIISPIVTMLYYYFIESLILDVGISRRARELERDAIDYFPVFLISLRCSRSVKKSLIVTNKIVKNKLSYEFDKIVNDVIVGKSLEEAIQLCIQRMPSEIIVNILISLIEADRLGNNIDKTVSIQLNYLKECNKKKLLNTYSFVSFKLVAVFLVFITIMLATLMMASYILSRI